MFQNGKNSLEKPGSSWTNFYETCIIFLHFLFFPFFFLQNCICCCPLGKHTPGFSRAGVPGHHPFPGRKRHTRKRAGMLILIHCTRQGGFASLAATPRVSRDSSLARPTHVRHAPTFLLPLNPSHSLTLPCPLPSFFFVLKGFFFCFFRLHSVGICFKCSRDCFGFISMSLITNLLVLRWEAFTYFLQHKSFLEDTSGSFITLAFQNT